MNNGLNKGLSNFLVIALAASRNYYPLQKVKKVNKKIILIPPKSLIHTVSLSSDTFLTEMLTFSTSSFRCLIIRVLGKFFFFFASKRFDWLSSLVLARLLLLFLVF
jgi:hypothetical protein